MLLTGHSYGVSVCSGFVMTLHVLKEMKFVEIILWFVAISLFVMFLGKIYHLIAVKLDLVLESVGKITKK